MKVCFKIHVSIFTLQNIYFKSVCERIFYIGSWKFVSKYQFSRNKKQNNIQIHQLCISFCPDAHDRVCIFEPRPDKTNIMGLQPAWIQTSLRIRAVWSGSMLFAISFPSCYRVSKWTAWILIRLRGCKGWSGSMLVANPLCWFCHGVARNFDSNFWKLMIIMTCLFC
jgi:hypothetical protein